MENQVVTTNIRSKDMKNIDIAHEFFYSDFNSSRNFNNINYSENLFYSYYTVIGAVVKSKTGNNILLVSEDSMSSTTGKHIGNLISAWVLVQSWKLVTQDANEVLPIVRSW